MVDSIAKTLTEMALKSVEIGKKYDTCNGIVTPKQNQLNFEIEGKRLKNLLAYNFLAIVPWNCFYFLLNQYLLKKMDIYTENMHIINITGCIITVPFGMLWLGQQNVINCEMGINSIIRYSTLAFENWQEQLKSNNDPNQGN